LFKSQVVEERSDGELGSLRITVKVLWADLDVVELSSTKTICPLKNLWTLFAESQDDIWFIS
jgi:hypothetical protein